MKLDDFMKWRNLDDAAMAQLIGDCTEHAVKKWRYRERIPRSAQMLRIAAATENQVTASDFYSDANHAGEAA
jgi:hypothetical protein